MTEIKRNVLASDDNFDKVLEEFDNIIMIFSGKDRAFAIPERVIEPEFYNEIRAILMSGTDPGEDE